MDASGGLHETKSVTAVLNHNTHCADDAFARVTKDLKRLANVRPARIRLCLSCTAATIGTLHRRHVHLQLTHWGGGQLAAVHARCWRVFAGRPPFLGRPAILVRRTSTCRTCCIHVLLLFLCFGFFVQRALSAERAEAGEDQRHSGLLAARTGIPLLARWAGGALHRRPLRQSGARPQVAR